MKAETLNQIIQENADRAMDMRPPDWVPIFRKWVSAMLGRAAESRTSDKPPSSALPSCRDDYAEAFARTAFARGVGLDFSGATTLGAALRPRPIDLASAERALA
jgi:hypothetical protein